jgi:arylsulfatase A
VHVPLHPGDKYKGQSANGDYGDWVEEADASAGRILDTLRALKLDEKTVVVFTSDNGPWLTQGKNGGEAGPLRGCKGGTFEGGVREPTIAWWPGQIAAGAATDAVAGNIDLLPTFVKLAGGAVPMDHKIDGADLSGVLLGRTKEAPREAHFYFAGNELQAVRSGPWKLAVAPQSEGTGKGKVGIPEAKKPYEPRLYNLEEDIGEAKDVAAAHPDVVKRLQEFATKIDADLGAAKVGPGVRPPGKVEKPRPLLLKAKE